MGQQFLHCITEFTLTKGKFTFYYFFVSNKSYIVGGRVKKYFTAQQYKIFYPSYMSTVKIISYSFASCINKTSKILRILGCCLSNKSFFFYVSTGITSFLSNARIFWKDVEGRENKEVSIINLLSNQWCFIVKHAVRFLNSQFNWIKKLFKKTREISNYCKRIEPTRSQQQDFKKC